MSVPSNNSSDVDVEVLIGRYLDNDLSDEETSRLLELFNERPEWKTTFWRQISVAAQLSDLEKGCGKLPCEISLLAELKPFEERHVYVDLGSQKYSSKPERRFTAWHRFGASVALAGVVVIAFVVGRTSHVFTTTPTDSSPTSIAVLTPQRENQSDAAAVMRIMSDVVWEGDDRPDIFPGQVLGAGWLKIRSGSMAIDFFNGASVTLEGPAEFQIVSVNKAFCSKGQLVAEVPPQAIGFQIEVPQMNVVDLGTSFSLDVSDKETLVHVLDGEVELHALPSGKELLQLGDAVLVNGAGQLDRISAPPASTVSPSRLHEIRRKQEHVQFERWKKQSEALIRDPSLLVRFDFLDKENRSRYVPNTALAGRESIPSGLMIDCRIAEGRWKEKGAIEFKRIADRMRFDIPNELESLTLAAWIRVDSIERTYNSIMTTDGFSEGEMHWQILWDGKVELGANTDATKRVVQLQTPSIITPYVIGQWIHLAVVVDNPAGEVVHYLNGEVVQRLAFRMPIPIRFKNLQLGNWTMDPTWPEPVHPIRHFSGAIDEFMLFSRPLSTEEIRKIHDNEFYVEE